MHDAYCVKRKNAIRDTHDELSYLTSLEQSNGQCQYSRCVAQGIASTYYNIFQRDCAALIDCIAYPENLQIWH